MVALVTKHTHELQEVSEKIRFYAMAQFELVNELGHYRNHFLYNFVFPLKCFGCFRHSVPLSANRWFAVLSHLIVEEWPTIELLIYDFGVLICTSSIMVAVFAAIACGRKGGMYANAPVPA